MPTDLSRLASDALLEATRALVCRSHAVSAELLLHLAEVDAHKLHLREGFSSLFSYCTEHLGLSESVTFNYTEVARLSRRLPAVAEVVRTGQVHLSGLRL